MLRTKDRMGRTLTALSVNPTALSFNPTQKKMGAPFKTPRTPNPPKMGNKEEGRPRRCLVGQGSEGRAGRPALASPVPATLVVAKLAGTGYNPSGYRDAPS